MLSPTRFKIKHLFPLIVCFTKLQISENFNINGFYFLIVVADFCHDFRYQPKKPKSISPILNTQLFHYFTSEENIQTDTVSNTEQLQRTLCCGKACRKFEIET